MRLCYRLKSWTLSAGSEGLRLKVEATQHPADTNLGKALESAFPGVVAELGDAGKVLGHLYIGGSGDLILKGECPSRDDVDNFLQAMSKVINVCDDCAISHCLDLYRIPFETAASPEEWEYTETGNLVYRAKYWRENSAEVALTKRVTDFCLSHPIIAQAAVVCAVPPSTGHSGPDLPATWASALGSRLSADVIELERTRAVSKQKEISELEKRKTNQSLSMQCGEELHGRTVLVLDDIYTQGDTMSEAARALYAASASRVIGLCAVKTAKGCRGLDTLLEQ